MKFTKFSGIALIIVSLLTPLAQCGQSAPEFKYATRYNLNGQVTGTIAAKPSVGGILKYLATRNTFNSQGLLTKSESGYLTQWKSELVKPSQWGTDFVVHNQVSYTYTPKGFRQSQVLGNKYNSSFTRTDFSYDAKGRLECKAVRMNRSYFHLSTYATNACTQGPLSAEGYDRITEFTYNQLDQVLTETRGVGTALQQTYQTNVYNRHGLRTDVYDANGNRTHFEYDSYGRLEYTYFPNATKGSGSYNTTDYERNTYDANGNLESIKKRNGNLIDYVYDNLNRIVKKDWPNTVNLDVYYAYDSRGLELYARYASHNGAGVTYQYDGFGRTTSETQNNSGTSFEIRSEYDENGNRDKLFFPDDNYFSFTYDDLDRLEYVKYEDNQTLLTNTYNNYGNLDSTTRRNGTQTGYAYDDISRLDYISENITGTYYDITREFEFNSANQVSKEIVSNNIFIHDGSHGIASFYVSNGLNQYTSVQGKTVANDPNGNLKSYNSISYSYDTENRLTGLTGSQNAQLSYDPKGRLYKLVINGVVTYFVYDGDVLVAEYNSSKTMLKRYVHSDTLDSPIVSYSGSSVSDANSIYLHRNHQGSVISQTNNIGDVIVVNTYDEYGVPGTANQGRFGFTGQVHLAELGLNYYKARIYHPKLGRFLQTDPVGYEDQMNLYAYVGNDPVNMVDPTGKFGLLGAGVGAVIGGLSSIAVQSFTGDGKVNWSTVSAATLTGAAVGATGGLASVAVAKIGLTGAEAAATVLVPSAGVAAVGGGLTQMVENTANGDPIQQGVAKASGVGAAGTIVGGLAGEKAVKALTNSTSLGPSGSLAGGKATAEVIVTGTQEAINQAASNTCVGDDCH